MSFCSKCGMNLAEGEKFCPKCGFPADGDEQAKANYQAQSNANTHSGDSFTDGVNSFINDVQNTEDHSAGYSQADISANKGISVLSYIGLLVLVPMLARKDSPFARFHSNQGLVLFITEFIVNIACGIIHSVFKLVHLGFIGGAITTIINLCVLALAIMGIVYAAEGKAKELPVIGKIKILK